MNNTKKKITIISVTALLLIAVVLIIYFCFDQETSLIKPTGTTSPRITASPSTPSDTVSAGETPSSTVSGSSAAPSAPIYTQSPSVTAQPTASATSAVPSEGTATPTKTTKPSEAQPSPTKTTPAPTPSQTSTPTPSNPSPSNSPSVTPSISPSPTVSLSPEQEAALLQCRALAEDIKTRTGIAIKFEEDDIKNHSYVNSSLSVTIYTDYAELLSYMQVLNKMLSEENYPSGYWTAVGQYTNVPTIILGKNIKKNDVSMSNVYGVTAWNTGKRHCDIFLLVCNSSLRNSGEAERIAHHEMFHFIEYVLIIKKPATYNEWTGWADLNPLGFAYNSSIDIGQGEDKRLKTSSLISWYAGTMASEDRAEIFSYMCMDTGEPSSFRLSAASYDPYIKTKANYLAHIINTELGLSNTVWESGAAAMNSASLPTEGLGSAITVNAIRLRETTLRNGISVVTIPQGAEVTVYRSSKEIMQIEYNGHIGYCDTSDISMANNSPETSIAPIYNHIPIVVSAAVIRLARNKRKLAA